MFCVYNHLSDDCHFLCSPFAYVDPLHCNMAYLYLELLKDSLNEYAYAAELAGLNYDLQNTVYGMYVSIHSFPRPPQSPFTLHPRPRVSKMYHPQTEWGSATSWLCVFSVLIIFYTVETLNSFFSCGQHNLYLLPTKS